MKTNVGALLFGAAVLSLFVPRRRNKESPSPRRVEPAAEQAANRLYALIQTRPTVTVLAISASTDELEREIDELNETWNHWALRTERHRFEIQPVPMLALTTAGAATPAPSREVARRN